VLAHPAKLGRSGLELFLGPIRHLSEGSGVLDSKVCEHLSVNLHLGQLQTMNQQAVRDTVGASACVDPHVPLASPVPFALLAMGVGVAESVQQGLVSLPKQPVTTTLVAARLLENLAVAPLPRSAD
jgi:hypothetical protein